MARAIDHTAIAAHILADPVRRSDVASFAPLLRPVDLRTSMWTLWLRDGGRPGTASYVGPLDTARVASATSALRSLTAADPTRRAADACLDRDALETLSSAAARSNERRCIALWVATMMWGCGMVDTRGPWRTAQGLASPTLGEELVASHRAVRAGDLAEAHALATSIHGMGEANATRWLWAVGLCLPDLALTPLPLDAAVRRSLVVAGVRPAHTPDGYVEYVTAMHAAAEVLHDDHGLLSATPERLEWTLARHSP